MTEVSNSLLRDTIAQLERRHPSRVDTVWVQRYVRVGPSMACALLLDLCAQGIIAVDLTPRGSGWTVELPADALRSILTDLDGSDHPPIDHPSPTVGEVELLDLAAEDRVLDPGQLDVDRSVAVREVESFPVEQQPHDGRVAHTFGEHQ